MLTNATARGETPFNLAMQLTNRLNVDLVAAYRIARTETAHAQISGQVSKYKEYGFTTGIFNATDPCQECELLDGQEFSLDEIERMIPKHPNCECSFLLKTGE